MDNLSSEGLIGRRPKLFRALGGTDPPPVVVINGRSYRFASSLKHDSWAATAVYVDECGSRIACKFNRLSPLPLGIPAARLGRFLAQREARIFRMMKDVAGFPRWPGPVTVDGRELPNAVAHEWIDGRPFKPSLHVGDAFFPALREMLAALHSHDLAYVDMSKWENLLVGDDGRPYLIDYQIHLRVPPKLPLRWLLRWAQAADVYYLRRHWRRCRPDQIRLEDLKVWAREPVQVWIAERAGLVFRPVRILVLRLHGVRGDPRKEEEKALAESGSHDAPASR